MPGALGAALLLSVYPLWAWRGDARMMASGRGVRLAAVHLRGGRVFSCWCTPRLTTSPGLRRRQLEHAAAGVVPGTAFTGAQ
ncbi:hypothetical protein KCP70_11290 [Salmonella enterica subsp. enterica]|nr:hypothetical protein KCP70_11290 [Salmonella enterica subsp. enterica]